MSDLVWFTRYFTSFVDTIPDEHKPLMLDPLHTLFYRLRAVAFEQMGYGRNQGMARDMFRFKVLFLTGEPLDASIRCMGNTKQGRQCGNRPYVGGQHCHVHASELEKTAAYQRAREWNTEYELVISAAGFAESLMLVSDRIDQIKALV